jgi:large subunit ribosomal protein L9
MKVLLLKDVYNLGRAGDVKKVANGFGRNYLIPQGLAVLATPGALVNVDRIRESANKQRSILNEEMAAIADQIVGTQLIFPARAGETGKLYGSITTQMIAKALSEKHEIDITKRQVDTQPIRLLGMHNVNIRLTMDLIPEISVVVYREGEPVENYIGEPVENYMVPFEQLLGITEEEMDSTEIPVTESETEQAETESIGQVEAPASDEPETEQAETESIDQVEAPASDEPEKDSIGESTDESA